MTWHTCSICSAAVLARPGSSASRALGALIHHANGVLLAIAWAYGVALVGLPANWVTGLLWGAILTALALWMMSALGSVHPAILARRAARPGSGGHQLRCARRRWGA
jgi:hypothetical protein